MDSQAKLEKRERLERYAEVIYYSLSDISLPSGASTASNRKHLYQIRQLSRSKKQENKNYESAFHKQPIDYEGDDKQVPDLVIKEEEFLDELVQSAPKRSCIVGEAGIGKSTLLEQLTKNLAKNFLDYPSNQSPHLPILLELKNWKPSNLETDQIELLWHTLYDAANSLSRKSQILLTETDFEELCNNGHAIILIDGLDEIRPSTNQQSFMKILNKTVKKGNFLHNCSVVLSSRPEVLQNTDLVGEFRSECLTLELLDPKCVDVYIQKYFHNDIKKTHILLKQLMNADSKLIELIRRPLLLSLLCVISEDEVVNLPSAPTDLLERGLTKLLIGRKIKYQKEATLELLGVLADTYIEHGDMSKSLAIKIAIDARETSKNIKDAFGSDSTEEILENLAIQSGILVPSGLYGYGFAEQTYAEYLSGRRLAKIGDIDLNRLLILFGERAWQPEWEEVLVWLAGVSWTQNRSLAIVLIKWVMAHIDAKRDSIDGILAMFAARLLSGAKYLQGTEEHNLGLRVANAAFRAWFYAAIVNFDMFRVRSRQLANMPRPAIEHFTRLLIDIFNKKQKSGKSLRVYDTLLEKPDEIFNENNLYNNDLQQIRAIESLGYPQLASDEVISALVGLLKNQDARGVWYTAASALGDLGVASDEVISALVGALKNPDARGAKGTAASALGELGVASDEVISALVDVLRNLNSQDYWESVASAIGKLGVASDEVISALVGVLKDPDALYARESAASALGDLGVTSDEVISALVVMLKNPDVRQDWWIAAHVLEKLRVASDEVVSALVAVLKNPDVWPSGWIAARVLGELGTASDEVISTLVGVLKDPDALTDWDYTVDALEKLGVASDEVISALVSMLKNPDALQDWWIAALALGDLGVASDEVISALVDVLKDPSALPVWECVESAAWALGELGVASDEVPWPLWVC